MIHSTDPRAPIAATFIGTLRTDYRNLTRVALSSHGAYALLGAVFGLLLVYVAHPHRNEFVGGAIEHIGGGFLVSSIVVVFYEWRSYAKQALNIISEFSYLVSHEAEKATFDKGLTILLKNCGDHLDESTRAELKTLQNNIKQIIESIAHLSLHGGWSRNQHVVAICRMVGSETSAAASAFAQLSTGDQTLKHATTTSTFVDNLLSIQMSALGNGDAFYALSDLDSWRNRRLRAFSIASLTALKKRHTRIRRLFNLTAHVRGTLQRHEIVTLLTDHLSHTQGHYGAGSYEVKIFGEAELAKLVSHSGLPGAVTIKGKHWGIFEHHGPPKNYIRYTPDGGIAVQTGEIERLHISQQHANIEEDIKLFEEAWRVARPLDPSVIAQVADAYAQVPLDAPQLSRDLQMIADKAHNRAVAPLFGWLAKRQLEDVQTGLARIADAYPSCVLKPNNPLRTYIETFVRVMTEIIEPGTEYLTITNLLLWSSDNFGDEQQRYLHANAVAATQRNVLIKRVFLIDQASVKRRWNGEGLTQLGKVLEQHLTILGPDTRADLRVYEIGDTNQYNPLTDNFAIWKIAEGHDVCTNVRYDNMPNGPQAIRSIVFETDPAIVSDKRDRFNRIYEDATPAKEYLTSLGPSDA